MKQLLFILILLISMPSMARVVRFWNQSHSPIFVHDDNEIVFINIGDYYDMSLSDDYKNLVKIAPDFYGYEYQYTDETLVQSNEISDIRQIQVPKNVNFVIVYEAGLTDTKKVYLEFTYCILSDEKLALNPEILLTTFESEEVSFRFHFFYESCVSFFRSLRNML